MNKLFRLTHKLNIARQIPCFKFLNYNFNFNFSTTGKAVDIKPTEKTGELTIAAFKVLDRVELDKKVIEYENEIEFNYGSEKRSNQNRLANKTEFLAKKIRQSYIRSGALPSQKHIIPVKRIRTMQDGLFKLLKQGEIACVIEGREEFPTMQLVIDKKYIKKIER